MGAMVELEGRRLRILPPREARFLVADVTGWLRDPWPLAGPVELELPRAAYFEYAFLDAEGRPFPDPDAPAAAHNPWYPYARAVRLPGAPEPPRGADELLGQVRRLEVGGRRLAVYEPPAGPAACLVVFDGVAYHRIGRMAHVAEELWRAGRIAPVRLVFSEPRAREREYRFDPDLLRHVTDAVVPEVAARWGAAERRGLWGASLGGLAALWMAQERPDLFALVGAQSPALKAEPGGRDAWRERELLTERLAREGVRPERVALQVGRLEWLLAPARRLAAVLAEAGVPHGYREFPSGHNWYTWRVGLAEGLEELLGGLAVR